MTGGSHAPSQAGIRPLGAGAACGCHLGRVPGALRHRPGGPSPPPRRCMARSTRSPRPRTPLSPARARAAGPWPLPGRSGPPPPARPPAEHLASARALPCPQTGHHAHQHHHDVTGAAHRDTVSNPGSDIDPTMGGPAGKRVRDHPWLGSAMYETRNGRRRQVLTVAHPASEFSTLLCPQQRSRK